MGEIVGAALVSHIPPIVMEREMVEALYAPNGTTLIDGLHRMRREQIDRLRPDTIVVLDSHWASTVEFIVTAHDRQSGRYTSDELPRGMSGMPYDFPGDPELAKTFAAQTDGRDDMWVLASADPYLPIHYATTNLLPFLQGDERWVSVSLCQTAEPEDFLLAGKLLGDAIASLDRRVVLLASGGLSHRFWPLRQFALHETAGLEHIRTPEARAADEAVIAALEAGDHRSVIEGMPAYRAHAPEGKFGHYLTMVGALGGSACTAPGVKYSAYESAAGTGQVHLWFDPPWQRERD